MDYITLDFTKKIDEKELLEAINHNHMTATLMKNEINKLSEKSTPIIPEETPLISKKETTNEMYKTEINEDFEDEVEYYFSMIQSLDITDSVKDDFIDTLPSKKNVHYIDIMIRLQAELLKQIKEIDELLIENKNNIDIEDLESFKEEISILRLKINILNEIISDEKGFNQEEEKLNTLIFVPKNSGNIRILEEIDHIDQEFLESFEQLFLSIKDGSFKNIKRFTTTNNKNAGVIEVKDFKTRVVFDRIGKNEYALITAFIKKSDSDKGYLEALELKVKNYITQQDELKEKLNDPDFILEQKEYEKILFEKLKSKGKEYKKTGGIPNDQ